MNQNSNFEPIFDYLPFRIMEKCILGTFSTFKEVSNSTKFSNFGLVESKIWFFKDYLLNLEFSNLKETKGFRTLHFCQYHLIVLHLNPEMEIRFVLYFKTPLLNLELHEFLGSSPR